MAEPKEEQKPIVFAPEGQIERAQVIIDTLRQHLVDANEFVVSLQVDITLLNRRIAELEHTLEHINDDVETEDGSDDRADDPDA